MRDFTPDAYRLLLHALRGRKGLFLRHDVDLHPERSLRIARIEAEEGFVATYYFRERDFDSAASIILDIKGLGHHIGYHYESLAAEHGDVAKAYGDFCRNLQRLRKLASVSTACAHGSPRSPWNSQDIWKQYDIKALGIDYEPMIDTDFSTTLYLTDTGRRWDGYRVSVRDKVPLYQDLWERSGLTFHTTAQIARALADPGHPIQGKQLLINTHPQRWVDPGLNWDLQFAVQQWKNIAKRLLVASGRK